MRRQLNHRSTRMSAARPALYLLAAGVMFTVAACSGKSGGGTELETARTADSVPAVATNATNPVERGKYLVTIGGCNDCHTPFKMGANGPEPDMTKMLSGHPEQIKVGAPPKSDPNSPWMVSAAATMTAWAGPWGISYPMNLTPDTNTGIGLWTEDQFMKTIRTGKHWGTGRQIMPPMPWPNYAQMTDEDLKAVYAYLRTIPPIVNHVPPYEPPTNVAAAASPAGADASKDTAKN